MEFAIFLVAVLIIALAYFIAKEFAFIAAEKGYPQKKYFWWTFLLGAFGMPMVIALPDKKARLAENYSAAVSDDELPDL